MRKSIAILFILIMGGTLAQAQTEKGRWTVGAQVGSLSYSSSGEPYKTRNFSLSLSPSVGYFVAKNLAVGTSLPVSYLTYGSTLQGSSARSKLNATSLGLGPFIRYYIGSAKLRPFANASYTYSYFWQNSTDASMGQESKSHFNYSSYTVGVGAAYFINNTVSLDASLNYGDTLDKNRNSLSNGSTTLNVGFRLFFGK